MERYMENGTWKLLSTMALALLLSACPDTKETERNNCTVKTDCINEDHICQCIENGLGTCGLPVPVEGTGCCTDADCAQGLLCNQDGVCLDQGSIGEDDPWRCNRDVLCESELLCNMAADGWCMRPIFPTSIWDPRCDRPELCADGYDCDMNLNEPRCRGLQNTPCTENILCFSGFVCAEHEVVHTCAPPSTVGEPCDLADRDADCIPNDMLFCGARTPGAPTTCLHPPGHACVSNDHCGPDESGLEHVCRQSGGKGPTCAPRALHTDGSPWCDEDADCVLGLTCEEARCRAPDSSWSCTSNLQCVQALNLSCIPAEPGSADTVCLPRSSPLGPCTDNDDCLTTLCLTDTCYVPIDEVCAGPDTHCEPGTTCRPAGSEHRCALPGSPCESCDDGGDCADSWPCSASVCLQASGGDCTADACCGAGELCYNFDGNTALGVRCVLPQTEPNTPCSDPAHCGTSMTCLTDECRRLSGELCAEDAANDDCIPPDNTCIRSTCQTRLALGENCLNNDGVPVDAYCELEYLCHNVTQVCAEQNSGNLGTPCGRDEECATDPFELTCNPIINECTLTGAAVWGFDTDSYMITAVENEDGDGFLRPGARFGPYWPPSIAGVPGGFVCEGYIDGLRTDTTGTDNVPFWIVERTDLTPNALGLYPYSVRFAGCTSDPGPTGCDADDRAILRFNLNTICFDPSRFRLRKSGIGNTVEDSSEACPPSWLAPVAGGYPSDASCISARQSTGIHELEPGWETKAVCTQTAHVPFGGGGSTKSHSLCVLASVRDVQPLFPPETSTVPEDSIVSFVVHAYNTNEACGGDRDGMVAYDVLLFEWRQEFEPAFMFHRFQTLTQALGSDSWFVDFLDDTAPTITVAGHNGIALCSDTFDWTRFFERCGSVTQAQNACDPAAGEPVIPGQTQLVCSAEVGAEILCNAWLFETPPTTPPLCDDSTTMVPVVPPEDCASGECPPWGVCGPGVQCPLTSPDICGLIGDLAGWATDALFGWIAGLFNNDCGSLCAADEDVDGGIIKSQGIGEVTFTLAIGNDGGEPNARLFTTMFVLRPGF